MIKMKEKRNKMSYSLLMLVLLCMYLLTGCEVYAPDFDKAVVTKDDQKIVLSVLAGQSTSDAGIEDMIDAAIAEKFPNVQLDWECVDWGENFDSQMQGKIASGDVPDIIIGKAQDVAVYEKGGNLAPITTADVAGIELINQDALDAVTVEKCVYGIPYNAWYQGVLYNKDIFRRLQLEVPVSYTELEQAVTTLEEHEITPFAAHYQESWKIGNMTMQFLINNVFSKVENWGTLFRRGNVSFEDNQIIKECFVQNQYVLDKSWKDALMIDQYESDRRFSEGDAAMYPTGAWSLQALNQSDTKIECGIFPYPNADGDASLIKETNMTFMVSESSGQKKLIFQILQELLSNEELMQEILDFTQSYSIVENIETGYESSIEADARRYEKEGKIVEATTGNNQIIWDFQSRLADETQKWLQGKESLEEVFSFADKNRLESGNE